MDDQIDFTQFWIMTAACEAYAPVTWLPAKNRAATFNLPEQDCSFDEMVGGLESLINAGDIFVYESMRRTRFPGEVPLPEEHELNPLWVRELLTKASYWYSWPEGTMPPVEDVLKRRNEQYQLLKERFPVKRR